MKRVLVALGVLVALAALSGCGSSGGSSRELERLLPRLIGPALDYEVNASGASSGRLRSAKVRASRLATAEGLTLDSAIVEMSEVRFDRDRQELLGVERADFSAILLQEDLNRFLGERSSLVKDLRVRLTPSGAQLRGSADIPGVRLPITPEFTLDGALAVDDMGRLQFKPDRIRVVGVEVPKMAAQLLASQINPLVDLTDLRLPVYLRSAEPGNGEVRLTGRALPRLGRYPEVSPNRE